MEDKSHVAAHLTAHAVDHVVGDAAVLALVGPADVLEAQPTAAVGAVLAVAVVDGVGVAAALVYPAVLRWWIRVEVRALERLDVGAEGRRLLDLVERRLVHEVERVVA